MRTFGFIFSVLFLVSCGGGGGGASDSGIASQETHNPSQITAEEISLEGNVPLAAETFNVKLNLTGFEPHHEDKIHEASDLIKQVISSQEFKDKVLSHTYNGKRQFANNKGLTNEQIYQKILEGAEKLSPTKDNEMDLFLKSYEEKSITVGYTYPNVKHVWMNKKYLDMYPAAKITTNMVHEWLHKIGFGHDAEKTAKRPHSVPYAVGYIVRDLAARI